MERLKARISQSAGLVSNNDLDPLLTILEVKGPNGVEQSCLCECVCARECVTPTHSHTQRERKSPCDCLLQLDEVLVCDSWGRRSNLSFIRPYWAVCRQVCVCVFSIKTIWQCFMSTFVCVPEIHSTGSSLMGCERYCTWTSPFFSQDCNCPLGRELQSLAFLISDPWTCTYVPCLTQGF